MRRSVWLLLAATAVPAGLDAQVEPVRVDEDTECRWRSDDTDTYCEVREYSLEPRDRLDVDSHQNGGIRVSGWDRNEIRVIARIHTWSRGRAEARELADEITIRVGEEIEPRGPSFTGRGSSWSVGLELMVPRGMTLDLRARNGGITLTHVEGNVAARTTNGGIDLIGGAGWIRGETTNGGLDIELEGERWDGRGVELETTNGGVRIAVPESYNAELETGTVNGAITLDIPVTVQGRITRTISTTLGSGGPLVRATTHNGGVVVRRP